MTYYKKYMQQFQPINPYKLSVRKNKDLIRQFNTVSLTRHHELVQSANNDTPYITIPNPNQNYLQFPPGYEQQRFDFQG